VKASGGGLGQEAINDLVVHPKDHNRAWAATAAKGLWWTHDGGTNWKRIPGLAPTDIRALALAPDDPNVLYAGAFKGGVYRGVHTPGQGWQWYKMAAGMDPNDPIRAIVVDPAHPGRVWAGSQRTGVHRWDAIEQQWVRFNPGLDMQAVIDLSISENGRVLYAATYGGGVYRLKLSH
jgi:hypothetical protein